MENPQRIRIYKAVTCTSVVMGNRINMTDLAGLHVYAYDDTYQLTNATHPNMPLEQFTYDAVGNRQNSEGQAPRLRNTESPYDFENRLIEVEYFGTLAQYKYDPFGRRIEKNVNGAITRYLYDGPNIVTEYDGAWNVQAQYTYTLEVDDPLTVTQGANTYYYHKDGLGSVVNLTDSVGNSIKSYAYKSFGEIYSETGSLVQPFTFTVREYDPESGLYFYRARYYDPRAGRFLTKDPIGFLGGDVNLYRYAANNPVNLVDPEGLQLQPGALAWGWGIALAEPTPIGEIIMTGVTLGVAAWELHNYFSKASKASGRERATEIPSWVSDYAPRWPNESCSEYAKRVLEEKYGKCGKALERGPGSEYSKIKKNCERNK